MNTWNIRNAKLDLNACQEWLNKYIIYIANIPRAYINASYPSLGWFAWDNTWRASSV